jgi:alginate O-acetyltransferase complex protein AlgI
VLGWVLFRMTTLADAGAVYAAMFGWRGVEALPLNAIGGAGALALLGGLLLVALAAPSLWRVRLPLNTLTGVAVALLLLVCVLRFDASSPFLYFQF